MGHININLNKPNDCGFDSLTHFCETYNLNNLINGSTYFTKKHKSSIDIILTNKSKSFQHLRNRFK